MVWVNTETHVYHKEGSRFYGTTKKGKYMTEAEAIKEENKAADLAALSRRRVCFRCNILQRRGCFSFNRFGFGHVFALFCSAVETRAFLVVNMRLGVNPNLAVASAGAGAFVAA